MPTVLNKQIIVGHTPQKIWNGQWSTCISGIGLTPAKAAAPPPSSGYRAYRFGFGFGSATWRDSAVQSGRQVALVYDPQVYTPELWRMARFSSLSEVVKSGVSFQGPCEFSTG